MNTQEENKVLDEKTSDPLLWYITQKRRQALNEFITSLGNVTAFAQPFTELRDFTPSGSSIENWEYGTPTIRIEKELIKIIEEKYDLITTAVSDETAVLRHKIDYLQRAITSQAKELFVLRKEMNLQKIDKIAALDKNWDGEGGEPIPEQIILKTKCIILDLELNVQPQIFPTKRGTLVLEYGDGEGKELDIEVFDDKFEIISELGGEEKEFETDQFKNIFHLIDEFRPK